jgi:hypothetical protein
MRPIVGAVMLLVSTATVPEAQTTRSILLRGTVRDSAGMPLGGRIVLPLHAHQPIRLRDDGSYVMPVVVPVGETTLTVRAQAFGYLHVDAVAPAHRDTVTVNFTLKRDPRPIGVAVTGPIDSGTIQRARLRRADAMQALGRSSGVYAFALCRLTCASVGADTLAEGRLALFASPLDSATLQRALTGIDTVAKRGFLEAGKLMFIGLPVNVCYVFDRKVTGAPRSVATRHDGALASLEPANADAHLRLYRSHEAWHFMTVRFDSHTFSGRGAAWTARQVDQVLEDDFIAASRIGDANLGICAEAALAQP